jgi:glyoxylase-like metal-dependent hydrolase (beta-lactamase superfamily II)
VTGRDAWNELAEGVYRRRYAALDLNVGLVLGEDGVLIVDTRGSHVQARELIDDVRRITDLPIKWVVDTHWHWDHTFGNAMFPDALVYGHAECRRVLAERGMAAKAEVAEMVRLEDRPEIEEVDIRLPDEVFAHTAEIELGNRGVTLSFHGRAHTEGDIAVTLDEAGVVFAGDILEESAPPWFGDGYPVAWPHTVAAMAEGTAVTMVPGHGDVMSPRQVASQLDELRAVAALAISGHRDGVPVEEVDVSQAPYPEHTMREALGRAYLELG